MNIRKFGNHHIDADKILYTTTMQIEDVTFVGVYFSETLIPLSLHGEAAQEMLAWLEAQAAPKPVEEDEGLCQWEGEGGCGEPMYGGTPYCEWHNDNPDKSILEWVSPHLRTYGKLADISHPVQPLPFSELPPEDDEDMGERCPICPDGTCDFCRMDEVTYDQ